MLLAICKMQSRVDMSSLATQYLHERTYRSHETISISGYATGNGTESEWDSLVCFEITHEIRCIKAGLHIYKRV